MLCQKVVRFFVLWAIVLFPLVKCFLLVTENSAPNITDTGLLEESRKKKGKDRYIAALIIGAILIKMVLFPLAVKLMAAMSGVSVLLSAMSLIVSSIVGYAKLVRDVPRKPTVKLVHINDIWAKGDGGYYDNIPPDSGEVMPNVPLDQHYFNYN